MKAAGTRSKATGPTFVPAGAWQNPRMRLIAFDLDGTLLDHDKTVPARSVAAVERLRDHGCRIAIITGRSRVPNDVLEGIRPDAVATNNGGTVRVGDRVVARHAFAPGEVAAIDAALPEAADVIAFGADEVFVRDPSKAPPAWLGDRTLLPLAAAQGVEVYQFSFHHPDARQFAPALERAGDFALTGGIAPYLDFMTVTPRLANKGQALRDLAAAFGLPLGRTVAFGDSDNDVAMFEVAGVAVQVGDAECLAPHAHQRVSCSALGLPGWLEELAGELARELV